MSCRGMSVLLSWAVACAACAAPGESRSGGRWHAVTDTVGDTVTVRTVAGSMWGDTASLEPEVSIGMVEGPEEYLIGDPRALAVGWDGVIYLLDRQVPIVRVYAPDGRFLRDIGREGAGPGEYRRPDAMAVLPDGRILVRDPGNARITVFDSDGAYLEHWWVRGGMSSPRRFYVDTAGRSYAEALLNGDRPPAEWVFGLARYGLDGAIQDTLAAPTWDYQAAEISARLGGRSSREPVPFTPQVSWTFSPLGYMVGGVSTEHRIDVFRADGSVLRIEREWTPVSVHPDEAEGWRRYLTADFLEFYPGWRWNGPAIPDTKPPFRDVFASWEGDIWVLRSEESVATMTAAAAREAERISHLPVVRFWEPSSFDVFAPDGRYLGHVCVPETLSSSPEPVIRGGTVWAVTRDEMDVATIVRFRLVRSGER